MEDMLCSLCDAMQNTMIEENDLINYIRCLTNIDAGLKHHLVQLIENDCYTDYLEIYNICLENNIELPMPM